MQFLQALLPSLSSSKLAPSVRSFQNPDQTKLDTLNTEAPNTGMQFELARTEIHVQKHVKSTSKVNQDLTKVNPHIDNSQIMGDATIDTQLEEAEAVLETQNLQDNNMIT
jgi:5-methylcytosine-specific restriction endonuclease McrBC GTP-binding regulatory subunit McrB